MNLGQILKQLREKKDVSIIYLAEKVDVSSSHISQIEKNKSSPSINVLKKIADVFDVPITHFFTEEKNSFVIKESERKKLILPNSHLTYELLSPSHVKDFQLLLTKIEIGGKMREEASVHPGQECCYIMKGRAEFIVDKQSFNIKEGESIYVPENKPHNVVNTGSCEVIIISAISPASF